jgi:hypothetical protein
MDKNTILDRLARGAVLKRDEAGGCRIGRQTVREAVISELLAEDLLKSLAGGRYDLSTAGAARVRRFRLRKGKGGAKGGGKSVGKVGAAAGDASGDDVFRAQHQLREARLRGATEGHGRVSVNLTESPLGWLRNRRDTKGRAYLDERHVQAGERLRADFELAALPPKVTAQWGGQAVSRGKRAHREATMTDRQLAARQRFHKAADAVPQELRDMTVRVCCFHEGLEAIEKSQGWPVRSGKLVLRIALEQLADFYGLARE